MAVLAHLSKKPVQCLTRKKEALTIKHRREREGGREGEREGERERERERIGFKTS
jgi:hypothetical protein